MKKRTVKFLDKLARLSRERSYGRPNFEKFVEISVAMIFILPSLATAGLGISFGGDGFFVAVVSGISLSLGVLLSIVYIKGYQAINEEWRWGRDTMIKIQDQSTLLKKLDDRYNLRQQIIDDIDRSPESESLDEDLTEAYTILTLLR